VNKFQFIHIFHDRGDKESANELERLLQQRYPEVPVFKPALCYNMATSLADVLRWTRNHYDPVIRPQSLLVGIGTGGLIACAYQEAEFDKDVSVVAINSPLHDSIEGPCPCCGAPTLELSENTGPQSATRIALYSDLYKPFKHFAPLPWSAWADEAYNVSWLQHGVQEAKYACAYLISCYMQRGTIKDDILVASPNTQERP
jgi:hypothetical protein